MKALLNILGLFALLILGFMNGFSCEEIQLKSERSGTYSLAIRAKNDMVSGSYEIVVNGVGTGSIPFTATTSRVWINFAASLGDNINIKILGVDDPFRLNYWIHNEANGGGRQVYGSDSTTFIPKNNCRRNNGCLFFVSRPFGESYPEGVSVRFFNQNNQTLLVYNGVGTQSFSASSSDTIKSVISTPVIGQGQQYMYRLYIVAGVNVDFYYFSYGTNAIIPNDQPPIVLFEAPTNGEVINSSTIPIQLVSTPISGLYNVFLTCPIGGMVSRPIYSNTWDPQSFVIPAGNYYGLCTLSIEVPVPGSNTVSVNILLPIAFSSPSDNARFSMNSDITVSLTSSPILAETVSVNQICGETTTTYENVQVGTEFDALPPINYTGNCTFSSAANQFYQASTGNPTVTILPLPGEVTITTPIDGAVIFSGGSTSIFLTSTPVSGTFTVQLNCGGEMITSASGITSNIAQNFVIPNNFHGSACVFSIIAPLNEWSVTNTVTVEVTDSLSPTGGKLYPITQEQAIKFAKLLNSGFNTFANIQNDN